MIVSQQMEDAVDEQGGYFILECSMACPGLALCRLKGDDDIPQEAAGIEVAESPLKLGEGENISRSVALKVGFVDFFNLKIIH